MDWVGSLASASHAPLMTVAKGLHISAHAVVLIILLSVIYWVRQSSEESAASWLVILLTVEVVWVLFLILQLLAPVLIKRYVVGITRGFSALVPVIWLVFVFHYTGREAWLTRWRTLSIGAIGGGLFAVPATNRFHRLVADFSVGQDPFVHLVGNPTVLQWVIFAIVYPFVFAGLLLLVDFILSTRHISRTQTLTIAVAAMVAMVTNVLMPLRLGPAQGFDYSGIGTGFFGAAIGWALFNERLFKVAPVARDSIFESFSDPLIAVDMDSAIVDFNAAATDLFPAIASAPGELLYDVVPALGAEDEDRVGDRFSTTRDGETRSFRIEESRIEAGNRQVGSVLQLREVTELEAYAQELERRTEQLEVKTDQLEGFASSVSHDLRNPINVAKGRIEIARETGDLEHLDTADDALDRGLETIQELLDLARSGQQIGDPKEVELESIVDNAWRAVDTQSATLTTEFDGGHAPVDPGRVQGLFENLFRNAIEHVGTDVSIRVSSTTDGFVVADDGPGIPEDERDQVFDHGYTGGDGTGLGLAKVESIALAHDWRVSIEEAETGGACFRFQNVF